MSGKHFAPPVNHVHGIENEIRIVSGSPAWNLARSARGALHVDGKSDRSRGYCLGAIEQDAESAWWRCTTCGLVGPYHFADHYPRIVPT